MQVLGQMLCTIDRAMLSTGATKRKHQVGEAPLYVAFHMSIGQSVDAVEEGQYLAVVFQELDDRFIQTRQLLIRLVAAGVVDGATIEDVATAIARCVLGDAAFVGEGEDADCQRPTPRPPCEGGSGMY